MKRLVFLFLCVAAFLAVAPAYGQAEPNPFRITIVRFESGTTPAQMQAAIANAGGDIVTDLSPIGAMAVVPISHDFGTRIGANAHVAGSFAESRFDAPVTLDGKEGSGPVGSPTSASPTRSPIRGTTLPRSSASPTRRGSSSGMTPG